MVHMAKIQRLMVSAFAVKVKANDATSKLSRLVNAAGGGGNSEND
jgi:hypothetical protein